MLQRERGSIPQGPVIRNKGTGMSLQLKRPLSLRCVFVSGLRSVFVSGLRGLAILTGIATLLLPALAHGADFKGPPAEGFKVDAVSPKWVSKKNEDKAEAKAIESSVRKIVSTGTLTGNETTFDNYFTLVYFPQWTQTGEKELNELPKTRDYFLRNYVE